MADELPIPKSRTESYLAKAAGEDVPIPEEPRSRLEQYLNAIAENGGGGGGGTSNFDQLTNRPKYNGSEMTSSTDIPEVKTYTAGSNISISAGNEISATDTKYTAGTNVSISDQNVISATDTTYSNFTGTDGTTAGTAGLVPAPTTTDGDKYLKGDGTWGTVQAGSSYTAGDGINISAQDVISATNTGKARVLTTADYNWPTTGTKTAVAPYLLEPGLYFAGSNVYLQIGGTGLSGGTFLVGANGGSIKKVLLFGSTNGSISSMAFTGINLDSSGGEISKEFINHIEDSLTSSRADFTLSAKQGKVLKDLIDSLAIRGAGAPTTSTAGQVGTLYEDTTNGKLYICTDATNPYVWEEVGGGSGPTVVQTTGTSTTDVMSQNATTGLVYADPATKTKVNIGGTIGSNSVNYVSIMGTIGANNKGCVCIKGTTTLSASGAVAIIGEAVAGSIAIGSLSKATGASAVAIGHGARATMRGQMDISAMGMMNNVGYNNSQYRLLTGLYDGQSAHDAATVGQAVGTTETYTIATNDWTALSASSPYDYQATVTATYTIGNNTVAELLNDNPVAFAANGFAIGSISSQSVTIYSIGQPSASTTLKINYKG